MPGMYAKKDLQGGRIKISCQKNKNLPDSITEITEGEKSLSVPADTISFKETLIFRGAKFFFRGGKNIFQGANFFFQGGKNIFQGANYFFRGAKIFFQGGKE